MDSKYSSFGDKSGGGNERNYNNKNFCSQNSMLKNGFQFKRQNANGIENGQTKKQKNENESVTKPFPSTSSNGDSFYKGFNNNGNGSTNRVFEQRKALPVYELRAA